MSDIGITFPPWFLAGLALLLSLPVTTAILAGLGVAYRIRRRDRTRRLGALKWSAFVVAPFWLAGLVFGGGVAISTIYRDIDNARHHFTLATAATVDGVAFPAGTAVALDGDKALASAELADGATLALSGATWRGKIVFTAPIQTANRAHGQIGEGVLAAPATFDGVPCGAEGQAIFFSDGRLMQCTLARDADETATAAEPDGVARARNFRCGAGGTIEMAGLRQGETEACRLAQEAGFGEVACAAGEPIRVVNGHLAACVFAKPARFGPFVAPAGTAVTYYDGHPSDFTLPAQGGPVDGFGLQLPAGTVGGFCESGEALGRLAVDPASYVTIEGVKLTGAIDFDCGAFGSGALFEDTVVGDSPRRQGERVSRADLRPRQGG